MHKVNIFKRSIRYKLFAVMFVFTIIPISIFGFISYNMLARVMINDCIKNNQLSNSQILNGINNKLNILQQQSYALNLSLKEILPILTITPETDLNYSSNLTRVYNYISTILLANRDINSIVIYNLEGYPVFFVSRSGGSLPLLSSKDEDWFKKTISLEGLPNLLEPHINKVSNSAGRNTVVVSIARTLLDIISSPTYEAKGILVIDSDVSTFSDTVITGGSVPGTINIILSTYGNIIYSNNNLSKLNYTTLFQTLKKSNDTSFYSKLNNQDYLVTYSVASQYGWYAVSAVPVSILYAKSSFIKQINTTLAIIITVFCLIGSIGLSIWITKPFRKLLKAFTRLQTGDFETQVDVKGYDEFSFIGKAFNIMIQNVRQLIKEKYELKLFYRQAELEMLQNQINPHFLYNTLNSIKAVIKRADYENSARMVENLSDSFRYSLNKGVYIVTIADELEHVRKYLFLQHFRFADRFSVNYDISDDTLQCPIPRLTLQPIVENAIIHGIKESDSNGIIGITSKTFNDKCYLFISNNGNIIPPERLEVINTLLSNISFGDNGINNISSQNVGIYNVCARIKLIMGTEYGIKISSIPDSGTIVKVTLPLEMKGKISGTGYENSYS